MAVANFPLRPIAYKTLTIYETTDPTVIIAEYDLSGEVDTTGVPYQLRYVQIFEIHNGEIVTLRDYRNPLGSFEMLNRCRTSGYAHAAVTGVILIPGR
ncbi:PhzA/PhzB family protein [Desulfosporosinus sp. OT]|uniref:nuclear transport factor 2 family protein n=1 Tax=Desulfosporosinus sp. OT TaxID=913865 RepID=UPI000590D46A|nr:PhzA/PhzB family protein [Desulfosporosinus sp. OT]